MKRKYYVFFLTFSRWEPPYASTIAKILRKNGISARIEMEDDGDHTAVYVETGFKSKALKIVQRYLKLKY